MKRREETTSHGKKELKRGRNKGRKGRREGRKKRFLLSDTE